MGGSAIPEEALVGMHVQVAVVPRHLVEGLRVVARMLPQTLHAANPSDRMRFLMNAAAVPHICAL